MRTIKCKVGKFTIDFQMRHQITLLCDDSATGKSFVFTLLKNAKIKGVFLLDVDSLKSFSSNEDVFQALKSSNTNTVIIDEADAVFECCDGLQTMIEQDLKNDYILISRSNTIRTDISDFATLGFKDNTFSLNYYFNVL